MLAVHEASQQPSRLSPCKMPGHSQRPDMLGAGQVGRNPGATGPAAFCSEAPAIAAVSHLRHEADVNSRLAPALKTTEEVTWLHSSAASGVCSSAHKRSGRALKAFMCTFGVQASPGPEGTLTRLHPSRAVPQMGDQPVFCLFKFLFLYIFFVLKRKA